MKKILAITVAVLLLGYGQGQAATGCNYPASHDTFTDRIAGDFLTTALLNSIMCGVEKLEAGPLRPLDGTVGAPGWSFRDDANSGVWRNAANEFTFVTDGVARAKFSNSAFTMLSGDLNFTTGAVGVLGTSDAFGLGFKTGGTERGRFDNSGNFEVGTADTVSRGRFHSRKSGLSILHNVVNLTDGGSTAIEHATNAVGASHGMLFVMTPEAVGRGCIFYIDGGGNTVTLGVNFGACSTTDSGTTIVVMSDGDGTYTLKNRLGNTFEFNLFWIGG